MKWIAIIWGWLLFGSFSTEVAGAFFLDNEVLVKVGAAGGFLLLGAVLVFGLVMATINAFDQSS